MTQIHFTKMIDIIRKGDPVTVSFWKQNGEVVTLEDAVALPYKGNVLHKGVQNFKILANGQIRKVRLRLIFMVNGMEVYL